MAGQPQGQAAELGQQGSVYVARLWRITRRDGMVIRLTDHDRKLQFAKQLYFPVDAVSTSATTTELAEGQSNATEGMAIARESGSEMSTGLRGGVRLGSKLITTEDLAAGKYRGAAVDEFLIDWRFPFAGAIDEQSYLIGELSHTTEEWEGDILGPSHDLERKNGPEMRRICDYELGDPDCKFVLGPELVNGTVAGSGPQSNLVSVAATYLSKHVANWFQFGELTFGADAGKLAFEVFDIEGNAAADEGEMTFALVEAPPFAVPLGVSVVLTPGCDKSQKTCIDKFDNIENFSGYPWITGTDRLMRSPSQS